MKSTGNSDVFADARACFRRRLREARPDPRLARMAANALAHGAPVRTRSGGRLLCGAGPEAEGLLFKFYGRHRYFDRWRSSRAKLAWAAGRALAELGVPAVEAVGFVEDSPDIGPFRSCLVMRELPGQINLREWVRRHHRALDADMWRAWRERLCSSWLQLGRAGVYHDDTKALNVLTRVEWSAAPHPLTWIDLESVRIGHRPGRRGILRNLVQLNGSLRKWVPDSERAGFLEQAAGEYPWLRAWWVKPLIRHWTRRRLLHEVRTRCGP